jgi:hypothetical protein
MTMVCGGAWTTVVSGAAAWVGAAAAPGGWFSTVTFCCGIHYTLRNVEIGIAKSRGPGQTLSHLFQDVAKLRQPLDARIPWLLIDSLQELIAFKV